VPKTLFFNLENNFKTGIPLCCGTFASGEKIDFNKDDTLLLLTQALYLDALTTKKEMIHFPTIFCTEPKCTP
jgi:hypothetical protein